MEYENRRYKLYSKGTAYTFLVQYTDQHLDITSFMKKYVLEIKAVGISPCRHCLFTKTWNFSLLDNIKYSLIFILIYSQRKPLQS